MFSKKEAIRLIIFSIIMGPVSLVLWIVINILVNIPSSLEESVTILLVIIVAIPSSLYLAKGKDVYAKLCYFLVSAFIILIVHYISFYGLLYLLWPTW
jgi:hypothetical protein